MKRLIVWGVLLGISYSYIREEEREKFERVVDYINVRYSAKYLSGLSQERTKYVPIEGRLEGVTFSSPLNFDTLSALLSSDFSRTRDSITEKINRRKYLFVDDAEPIKNFNSLFNNNDLSPSIRDAIESKNPTLQREVLSNYYTNPSMQEEGMQKPQNSIGDNTHTETPGITAKKPLISWKEGTIMWIAFSVLFILLLHSIWFHVYHRRSLLILKQGISNLNDRINHDRQTVQEASNKTDNLIQWMEVELKTILIKHEAGSHSPMKSMMEGSATQKEQARSPIKILYGSTPQNNGSFNELSVSDTFRQSASYYEFKIDMNDPGLAHFSFVEDPEAVRSAIGYPETFILPVCKANNALSKDAKRIKTTEPGILKKEGNQWILNKKAIIEYE